jgi:hypothetical protein
LVSNLSSKISFNHTIFLGRGKSNKS